MVNYEKGERRFKKTGTISKRECNEEYFRAVCQGLLFKLILVEFK